MNHNNRTVIDKLHIYWQYNDNCEKSAGELIKTKYFSSKINGEIKHYCTMMQNNINTKVITMYY